MEWGSESMVDLIGTTQWESCSSSVYRAALNSRIAGYPNTDLPARQDLPKQHQAALPFEPLRMQLAVVESICSCGCTMRHAEALHPSLLLLWSLTEQFCCTRSRRQTSLAARFITILLCTSAVCCPAAYGSYLVLALI